MDENIEQSKTLHYGSRVTLSIDDNGYLFSNGFIDNSLHLYDSISQGKSLYNHCVFRIVPQCSYSVQNTLL